MKKILITRKLIKESEDKATKTFNPIFNSNDELYLQSKVIEMSKGCDGILTSLTDKMDKQTIDKLPESIPPTTCARVSTVLTPMAAIKRLSPMASVLWLCS